MITSEMTWSYSRISTFDTCPYSFFLRYIMRYPTKRLFFSDYGSFIHNILKEYLSGGIKKVGLAPYYLANFQREVCGAAPSSDIYLNYFRQGLRYLESISFPSNIVVSVEEKVDFVIDGVAFTGYIDAITDDKYELCIVDHKSRDLKARSVRKKPLKTDGILDEYLRQLYIYSIPVLIKYGKYPDLLIFNCYRTQNIIKEPFVIEDFNRVKEWAINSVSIINNEKTWSPNVNLFRCKYLCDVCQHCEYYRLFGGGSY